MAIDAGIRIDPVELAKRVCDLFLQAQGDNLVTVALYGSAARGDWRPGSDIDLLVVVEAHPPGLEGSHSISGPVREAAANELLGRGVALNDLPYISIIVRERRVAGKHVPLYLDLTEDAVLLYDKGGFFAGVLDEIRARMRELGSHRVWLDGGWYWRLKAGAKFGEEIEI